MPTRHVGPRRAVAAARELLEERHSDSLPIDVDALASSKSIDIVYESLARDTSAVLIRRSDGRRFIGINSLHARTRQRFSVAHELGHALLHLEQTKVSDTEAVVDRPLEVMFRDGLASEGSNRLEIDANSFAAELLMPESLVRQQFADALRRDANSSIESAAEELAQIFDVSYQALRYRLINLNLADPA